MFPVERLSRQFARRPLLFILLAVASVALLAELVFVLPIMLNVWHPYDYSLYIQMGKAVLEGKDPVMARHYYPLPTILWLFIPLSFTPDWFRLVWILIPFVSVLYLFQKRGLILFFFTPFWIALADATIDPVLLIPIAWLLLDTSVLAPLGAILLLFKPQLAIFLIAYRSLKWLFERNWKQLGIFVAGVVVLCAPAFILQPNWPLRFLQLAPLRVTESVSMEPLMTASVWSWAALDNPLRWLIVPILIAVALLFWLAWRHPENRAPACLALGLLILPIFFASSLVAIVPALRRDREIWTVTLISLLALLVDHFWGPFGGLYAFICIAYLAFLCERELLESRPGRWIAGFLAPPVTALRQNLLNERFHPDSHN